MFYDRLMFEPHLDGTCHLCMIHLDWVAKTQSLFNSDDVDGGDEGDGDDDDEDDNDGDDDGDGESSHPEYISH